MQTLIYYFFAGLLRYQVEVGKNDAWLKFFGLVVDLVADWQACTTDEERDVFVEEHKKAIYAVSAYSLPDDVVESRILAMRDGHLI